jgi:hypothetical protein
LADYFAQKSREESGHDRWADEDLAKLRRLFALGAAAEVPQAIQELVAFLTDLVNRDPRAYLGYVFFAEYFTVLLGPIWIAALERCGVPAQAMSVVANHVELDVGHVESGSTEMDILTDEGCMPELRAVLSETMRLYDGFLEALTIEDRRWQAPPASSTA